MSAEFQLLVGGMITIIASGGMATIVVRWMERRNLDAQTGLTDAQATDVLVTAGEKAVGILEGQLDRAMSRLDHLEEALLIRDARIAELEKEVVSLKRHVQKLESEA